MPDLTPPKVENIPEHGNDESQEVALKYPRSIPFIVLNEFCERFNYYGMRSKTFSAFLLQKSNNQSLFIE